MYTFTSVSPLVNSDELSWAGGARCRPGMGSLRQLKGVLVRNLAPSVEATPGRRRLGCFFTVHLIDASSGALCEPPVYTSTLCTEASNPSWTDVDHLDMRVELAPPDKAAGWARGVFGIRVWSCEGTGSSSAASEAPSPRHAGRGHAGTHSPAPRAGAGRILDGGSPRATEESAGRATMCDAADCSRRADHFAGKGVEIFGVVERGAGANGLGEAGHRAAEDDRHGERELETRVMASPSGGGGRSSTFQRKNGTTLALEVIPVSIECSDFVCARRISNSWRSPVLEPTPFERYAGTNPF